MESGQPAGCPGAAGERRVGRPPDLEKRAAILEAGRVAFTRDGYGASMDQIAQDAGVSKQTIYKHFSSKEALFLDIVRQRCERVTAPLVDHPPGEPPAVTLHRLGLAYLDLFDMADYASVHRLLAAEVGRFPGLVSEFFKLGPDRSRKLLVDYLKGQVAAGALRVDEPDLAAEQFFGLVAGQRPLRAVYGQAAMLTPAQADQRVRSAVAVFLGTYGVA
jgi:TetR/AcrR family transcriptional repressor of mexJK operon